MPAVVIRNLPEETVRALKARAREHGTSTEAEIRTILAEAVRPATRIKLGSELLAFGRKWKGVDLEIVRNTEPAEAAHFE